MGDHVVYLSTWHTQGGYSEERNIEQERCINLSRFYPNTEINGVDDETAAAGLLKGMTVYMLLFHTWVVRTSACVIVRPEKASLSSKWKRQ